MPNTFAYIALFSWPAVVLILYRRLPRANALVASIISGYLLLPYGVKINPPVLPTFDKDMIPAISAFIFSLIVPAQPERLPRAERRAATPDRRGFTRQTKDLDQRSGEFARDSRATAKFRYGSITMTLLVLLFIGPFVTYVTNREPIFIGERVLPGLRLYDAFSNGLTLLIAMLPFLLARRYLSTLNGHLILLRGLVVGGLFYVLPALFEVRMSPQLSTWVYGFLAQSFLQSMRDGSFRPVVFLQHGLWLAVFMAIAVLSAVALWRQLRSKKRFGSGNWALAFVCLFLTLVLCHSFGALFETIALLPLAFFLRPRAQLMLISVVAVILLTYPVLRGSGLIPANTAVSIAETISQARAQSLEFRLRNEDQLLAHASQKPLAGWGGWGRSRVYDLETGRDVSVTDGAWIIAIGTSGWMGYIARFGLLTAPLFLLWRRSHAGDVTPAAAGLAIVLTANLIDMIPNATLTPITWLIAGALTGYAERLGETKEPAQSYHPAKVGRERVTITSRTRYVAKSPNLLDLREEDGENGDTSSLRTFTLSVPKALR